MKYKIETSEERNSLFDALGIQRLKDSYMRDDETSPQERFAFVSSQFASNQAHAQRLYDHSSKHWLSYATPILSFGKNKRGQPISCFLNYLDDTSEGLVNNLSETNWLSMMGGGVGVHVGIRGSDSKSTGVMPHLKTYDASSLAYRQDTRRGSYAAYLDISHPDVMMFLEMRKATGDQNQKALNLHHGINIPDKFMEIVERCMVDPKADDSWDLIQPSNGKVVETVSAKELWMRILEIRAQTGEPYIWFIDEANRKVPEFQKKAGLKNHGSNLCVAPETLILTPEGQFPIVDLVNQKREIWNGFEWSEVEIKKTGENQKLIEIVINSGKSLFCTEYHKFYVEEDGLVKEKRAAELVAGDVLIKSSDQEIGDVVVGIYDEGRFDDTYCFYEPKRHMGVFNGILTGQCSEISLVTNAERTAVCCLSSVNLEYYDEWKDHPTFLRDVHEMLDNVISYFVENAPDTIKRAKFSALRERSIGIGALGFHAYLQKNSIPFESVTAKLVNNQIFSHIREQLDKSNYDLAVERGACPDAADYGVMVRNAHVMSIAPNASSSIIMGNTSPSIEPYAANAYRQDTTSGAYLNKNRFLDVILKDLAKGQSESWYDDTWASIIANEGSAQHLDCLTEDQKEVFKTAMEIDQRWVIEHSADRQVFVDQAISTNVFFRATANIKYIHAVHFLAWKKKLKSLYYYRSEKLRKADQVGKKVERKKIEDEINMQDLAVGNECLACEG